MIGKKKAHVSVACIFHFSSTHLQQDVQFYREASDVQFDETGNRKRKHRYGDEDEIEMEQMERKRRQTLNKEFRHFADKVAEAAMAAVRFTAIFFLCHAYLSNFLDW
jgi:nucleosome binding factor SPN SPT16 subunit